MEKPLVIVIQQAPGRWEARIDGTSQSPVYGKTKMEALGILFFFNRQAFAARIQVEEL